MIQILCGEWLRNARSRVVAVRVNANLKRTGFYASSEETVTRGRFGSTAFGRQCQRVVARGVSVRWGGVGHDVNTELERIGRDETS